MIAGALSAAGMAMVLGVFALMRNEPKLPALIGFSLATGTLFFVWLQWIAFVVVGALLIGAVIIAIGGDLSI